MCYRRTATPKGRSPTRSSGFRVTNPMRISSGNYTRMPKSTVAISFFHWRDTPPLLTSVRRTTSSSRTRSNSDVPPCPARSTRRASSRQDVDLIVTTTVTGLAVPSLDARIAGRLGLRPDVRRVPLFGLGCVAGAAGVGRLNDYLRGAPDDVAVLVSVELCSLTYPGAEPTIATMVGSALFADGASAVVAVGDRRAERIGAQGPTVVDSRSRLYPDSLTTMGWNFGASGLSLVLSPNVATLIERHLADDLTGFLTGHGLTIDDIGVWVSHPGGPKVIEAINDALVLPDEALELTWRSLSEVGNLSSSSVLHVLRDTLAKQPASGSPGVLMAMGPGFCAELVLLRWH